MKPLERYRIRINKLDKQLVDLLEERAEIVEEVGRVKRASGTRVYDPGREREVRDRLAGLAKGKFPSPALEAIFREIVSASRALEQPTQVGFLGRRGSLAHWAALRRFGSSSSFEGYETGQSLLSALENGDQEFALVSLESQAEDPSFDAFDILLSSRARVFGEFVQDGGVVLLGRSARGSRRVYGQPAFLELCSKWLESRKPKLSVHAIATSEEAAERAIRNKAYCIGTPALETSQLKILADPVADAPRARRRFLILSLSSPPPSGKDKTAFLAVLPHHPGALHGVLGALARKSLNLVWIESRASQGRAWQHVFLFEFEGHLRSRRVREAIEQIRKKVDFYKGLGSFPAESM